MEKERNGEIMGAYEGEGGKCDDEIKEEKKMKQKMRR